MTDVLTQKISGFLSVFTCGLQQKGDAAQSATTRRRRHVPPPPSMKAPAVADAEGGKANEGVEEDVARRLVLSLPLEVRQRGFRQAGRETWKTMTWTERLAAIRTE